MELRLLAKRDRVNTRIGEFDVFIISKYLVDLVIN
jgi:hypothetical protein